MPTAITRGAASAKAFGFTSGTGGVGYKYLGQVNGGSALYASNTAAGLFPPVTFIDASPLSWNSLPLAAAGIIANGKVICVKSGRSENNGGSWYNYNNNGYYQTAKLRKMAAGPNGGVAYDPVTNVMGSPGTYYDGKSNVWGMNITTINSTPTAYGNTTLYIADGYYPGQIVFWPLFGYFYMPMLNYPLVPYISATATSGSTVTWGSSNNNQRWCINPTTGYLYASNNSTISEVYDAGFSSYATVGSDSYSGYIHQSVPVKGPSGYWYKLVATDLGSPQMLVSDNTNYPTGWGYLSSPLGGQCHGALQLLYDSGSTFYCSGMLYNGKDDYTMQQYSADGGSSWSSLSSSGSYQAIVKNLK